MSGQLVITVLICLYVISRLSIRKSDSMEIMMLPKLGTFKASQKKRKERREKKEDSQSELLVCVCVCGICL